MPESTGRLCKHEQANFNTLMRAARRGDLVLVSCTWADSGKPVAVLCMSNIDGDEADFVPVATLIDGNPYELLNPPEVPA